MYRIFFTNDDVQSAAQTSSLTEGISLKASWTLLKILSSQHAPKTLDRV